MMKTSRGGAVRGVLFLMAVWGLMAAPAQAKLMRSAKASSVSSTTYKYETAHFAIYYQTTGDNAVYGASNVDGNGVPVAIDSIGVYAERSWALAVDTLGFKKPTGVETTLVYSQAVPTGKMPIEIGDVGIASSGGYYNYPWMGETSDPSVDSRGLGCDMVIENDFLYDSTLKPIVDSSSQVSGGILYNFSTAADIYKGWKVSVSHEFFHTVEYAYEYSYQYSFHEMCAVWFEIRAYPEIHHHWTYLPNFIGYSYSGAFATGSGHYYSNHAFVREFAHVFGDTAVRKIWEYRSRHMYLSTTTMTEAPWFADAMDSCGYSQVDLFRDYSIQLADLLYNQPGLLNDDGLYEVSSYVQSPILHSTKPDTGSYDRDAIEMEDFGFNGATYSWGNIPSGMHLKIDSSRSTANGFGFIVRLPSKSVMQYDPRGKNIVLGIDNSDTAISVIYIGGTIETEMTYDAITGVVERPKTNNVFTPKVRVDIHGRPVGANYHGVVIESDGTKTVPVVRMR